MKKTNVLPCVYTFYANLDELRMVEVIHGNVKEKNSSILKYSQYGRYNIYNVFETYSIGEDGAPLDKVTIVVMCLGRPALIARGVMMNASVAMAQAKESLNILPRDYDYSKMYKEGLRHIKGLNPGVIDLVLKGTIPVEYESLTFSKAMDEEMSLSERLWLFHYISVYDEYVEHHELIEDALSDFCDAGRHRIFVLNKKGTKSAGEKPFPFPMESEHEILNGVAVWV